MHRADPPTKPSTYRVTPAEPSEPPPAPPPPYGRDEHHFDDDDDVDHETGSAYASAVDTPIPFRLCRGLPFEAL